LAANGNHYARAHPPWRAVSSLENAKSQRDRVVSAWAAKTNADPDRIRAVVDDVLTKSAFKPLSGLAGGGPLVNVLEVNLEIARRLAK
jgi:K+-transporting ATPase c subunit